MANMDSFPADLRYRGRFRSCRSAADFDASCGLWERTQEGPITDSPQDPYARGISWPMTAVGVIAAILLGAGILPPYFEIWKRGGRCIGISELDPGVFHRSLGH